MEAEEALMKAMTRAIVGLGPRFAAQGATHATVAEAAVRAAMVTLLDTGASKEEVAEVLEAFAAELRSIPAPDLRLV